MKLDKNSLRKKRARRVKAKIEGAGGRPRLSVFRSLNCIYAQIIDDEKGMTLASFDSRKIKGGKNNIETAKKIGKEIAKLAKVKKIEKIVFDRKGYKYHGKVKALAEGAREEGLQF
ncbi:MAG: 50S ribosomal protein L18 [Candidatus Moranbacteria bacterium]|nr:50S ribosomal protein L18 [Candidatus Moranbacteria bacterium]